MSKRFCSFQTPLCENVEIASELVSNDHHGLHKWPSDAQIEYRAESRWFALCAFHKEEILALFSAPKNSATQQKIRCARLSLNRLVERTNMISMVTSQAMADWDALPLHFKLQGSLKQCSQDPFERDFLVSLRLNHLHVLFLLQLLSLDRRAEPDDIITMTSHEIVGLVVEAILLREQLSNSGTSLVWKVCDQPLAHNSKSTLTPH